jgi:Cu/Ag efflux protein CusF
MTFRMIRLALGAAALALAASSPVIAQGVETRGTVQRVDVPSGTVYFTDGRTAHIEPGSTLTVDGRPVSLADVQPGWTLVIPGVAAAAPPSVVVAAPAPTPAPARPAVDATGVVSRVDPQTGTIVLEDGRVLQVTGRTTIWQPVPMTAVKPGASVYMRNADPIDFRPNATSPPAGSPRFQMGTVTKVDAASGRVTLSDGSVVRVAPGTRLQIDGRPAAVADLRPGDEIVIGVPRDSALAVTSGGASALPVQAYVIEGTDVYVVRRPQSP